ncbi:hypothetical protein [Flammeovirga aprica]|uniref:Uncharacterized protein n=1 Tax=Flammeovirga aprica JL-4 TaxID=694437 RepID=A0A7X9P1H8_9BACT|nr:hypothetical protein [Flammeovirga aprica]NME67826.1 hypothetical protein [Flammeovirga aprica JL-4]
MIQKQSHQKEIQELLTFCKNAQNNVEQYLSKDNYYNRSMMLITFEHLFIHLEDYLVNTYHDFDRQSYVDCTPSTMPVYDYDGKVFTLECASEWVGCKIFGDAEEIEQLLIHSNITDWKIVQNNLRKTRALVKGLRQDKNKMPTKRQRI